MSATTFWTTGCPGYFRSCQGDSCTVCFGSRFVWRECRELRAMISHENIVAPATGEQHRHFLRPAADPLPAIDEKDQALDRERDELERAAEKSPYEPGSTAFKRLPPS